MTKVKYLPKDKNNRIISKRLKKLLQKHEPAYQLNISKYIVLLFHQDTNKLLNNCIHSFFCYSYCCDFMTFTHLKTVLISRCEIILSYTAYYLL